MIIGLTGRIAAGKGVVAEYMKENGFEYFTVSQIVREEAIKRGVEITRYNLQTIGNEVRAKFGLGAWIKKILEKIEPQKDYLIDGIRNPGEVLELQKTKDFYLISIDADQELRFKRVLSRSKESDPKTWEKFLEIDDRDFGIGEPLDGQQVGKCMEMANFHITNNGDLKEYVDNIDKIFNSIKS